MTDPALSPAAGPGTLRLARLVSGLPMLVILLLTLLAAVGENLHSRMLAIGAATWPDYYQLRIIHQVREPRCDPAQDLDAAVARAVQARQAELAADPFADLLGGEVDRHAIRRSIETRLASCNRQWADYQRVIAQDNWQVRSYAALEMGVSQGVVLVTGNRRILLGFMLLFCAAAATLRRQHIALRPVESRLDDQVATLTQLIANALLTLSAWLYRSQELAQAAAGMPLAHLFMHDIWVAGFGALTVISAWQLFRPRLDLPASNGLGRALLSIPLYSFMCISSAIQFAWHGFYHGIAVYLNMMAELSALFLSLGLYVWVGMLLARSHLPQKVFDVFRPLRLPPKWLGVVVLFVTAFPTAYSGASGIFILAAGVVLYRELRRAGTSEQLALATTAISGSMGTMLRPCLLVVIVATLNNSVTTDELFSAGARVLMLTLFVYTVFVLLLGGRSTLCIAPLREAVPGVLKAMVPLLPYVLIFAGVILAWSWIMGRGLNEFSAPAILPLIMLLILAYERYWLKQDEPDAEGYPGGRLTGVSPGKAWRASILKATDQSTALIGALLMLMALSVSVGGLLERSGVMELFPDSFASVWMAVAVLMFMLVLVGMIMDPYGAVILVNATLAPIALANGLNPLHFWIMTILAFEMGYLTPPVALNHLLTRQVVGMPTGWASQHGNFYQRNFRFILPILVMGTTLLLVAFLPLTGAAWFNLILAR